MRFLQWHLQIENYWNPVVPKELPFILVFDLELCQ